MGAACHAGAPRARLAGDVVVAAIAVVVAVVVAAVLGASAPPARAAGRAPVAGEPGDVTCPAELHGVPLSTDEEFAGTPRALANAEGVVVRFTLLCPYHQVSGASVAELTLAWTRYPADDLRCHDHELTSEPADGARVQGALDHPTLSARVTYGAASAELLPAVHDVATELLADVPSDAYPCVGGADTGVDATLALPAERASSSSPPIILTIAVLAGSVALIAMATMLARRISRRRRATAAAPDPDLGDLVAATTRRAKHEARTGNGSSAGAVTGGEGLRSLLAERAQWAAALRAAESVEQTVGDGIERLGRDLATDRAHAQAVRDLLSSWREGSSAEYLASYAGVMTLAVAATNLVGVIARRASDVVSVIGADHDGRVAVEAAHLDAVHRQVMVAGETALDDTRFSLWQDRRHSVVAALAALEHLVPQQLVLHHRLADRVGDVGDRAARTRLDAERARHGVDDLDRRLVEAQHQPPNRAAQPLEPTIA